jgi:hypothetical protein
VQNLKGVEMSTSSLWVMDKDFYGNETVEYRNSWLFSPIVWDVLLDKYMREEIKTPYGYKKSFFSDNTLFSKLNNLINNCDCISDRICWELSNQQVFFSKDKNIVSESIREFLKLNEEYDKTSEGTLPLKTSHISDRFIEIANTIIELNELETPYFIFKNTSCDDGVERWFSKYNKETEDYETGSLKDFDESVTEFVSIENGVVSFEKDSDFFKRLIA